MTFSWLIPYIAVSLIIVLIPGQDMIFVMTQSIASGVKAGIKTVLGSITGTFVHTLLAAVGLSIIFQKSNDFPFGPNFFRILIVLGVWCA